MLALAFTELNQVQAQVSISSSNGRSYVRLDLRALQDSLLSLSASNTSTLDTVYLPPHVYFEISDTVYNGTNYSDIVYQSPVEVGFDATVHDGAGPGTLTLKENNTRIRFWDTSSSASFPTRDWELTANQSANGGANMFAVYDVDQGTLPFVVDAASPDSALYIDASGIAHMPYGLVFDNGSVLNLTPQADESTPTGTMMFWDGSEWVTVAPGSQGETLKFCNGAPQWGPCN